MKMRTHLMYVALTTGLLLSCVKESQTEEKPSELMPITQNQFAGEGMQLGEINTHQFENIVSCNGTIVPLPNGLAQISAPISGIIKNIGCYQGQAVEVNQTLLEISGNEIIQIQKEFAESSADYKLQKSNFKRIKSLYLEKVITEKEFTLAESAYKSALAKYKGLKLQLESLGLLASNIEYGDFYTSYFIKSPIQGYVSAINNSHIGSFVHLQTPIIEVTNPNMFQLELSVYTADINKIKKGQSVRFKSVNNDVHTMATISAVGVSVNADTKAIHCYASINTAKAFHPVSNQYVDSEIITAIDSVQALPTEAILQSEDRYFVFEFQEKEDDTYFFKQVEVHTGRQQNGFTEIIGKRPEGQMLIKGVYNVSM